MKVEAKLKALILSEYGRMSAFSEVSGIPNSTLSGIFSRGIENSNTSNVKKICSLLNISTDELYAGRITPNTPEQTRKPVSDLRDVLTFARMQLSVYHDLTLDGSPLTDEDVQLIEDVFEILLEIIHKRHRRTKE